jgi:hypothetical protein
LEEIIKKRRVKNSNRCNKISKRNVRSGIEELGYENLQE